MLVLEQLGSSSVRFPALPRHGRGDSEHGNDSLTVLEAKSPKSRCRQYPDLSEGALGGRSWLASSQCLWFPDSSGFFGLQLLMTDPLPSPRGILFGCHHHFLFAYFWFISQTEIINYY